MFIKSIHLNDLQNEEHFGFQTYVDELVDEASASVLKVEPQQANHKLKLAIERTVLDLIRKSAYTSKVNDADTDRDRPIRGFFKVVKGLLHHFTPAISDAAYRVDVINESFSDITRLSKEKQTNATISYLDALRATGADIATLGLADWVTEIERTNNVYVDLVKNRFDEKDEKPNTNMKEARVETDEAYRAIVDRINAFITIDGDAQYATFVTKLNNRIDSFAIAIAQRKGRAAKKEEVVTEEVKQ